MQSYHGHDKRRDVTSHRPKIATYPVCDWSRLCLGCVTGEEPLSAEMCAGGVRGGKEQAGVPELVPAEMAQVRMVVWPLAVI